MIVRRCFHRDGLLIMLYATIFTFAALFQNALAFMTPSCLSKSTLAFSSQRSSVGCLFLVEDDQEVLFGNSDLDATSSSATSGDVYQALKERQKSLSLGIGKRYVTRTQRGFLNVHYEPSDPHDCENVVSQLKEGQIVTSTGPQRGQWIPHDGGGWSVAKYGGFTWLEPIDE